MTTQTCPPHHWILDSDSNGYCKKCNAVKNIVKAELPIQEDTNRVRKCKQLTKLIATLDNDTSIPNDYKNETRPILEGILARYK